MRRNAPYLAFDVGGKLVEIVQVVVVQGGEHLLQEFRGLLPAPSSLLRQWPVLFACNHSNVRPQAEPSLLDTVRQCCLRIYSVQKVNNINNSHSESAQEKKE